STETLTYHAIPAAELDRIRAAGRDDAGNPLTVTTGDGSPLRCCLREARDGEPVTLIAYAPPGTAGAYAECGPVFIHAQRCAGYPDTATYPPGLAHRRQIVRAYNDDGAIADAVLAKGTEEIERAAAELLSRDDVRIVHIRNITYGCYNFSITASAS